MQKMFFILLKTWKKLNFYLQSVVKDVLLFRYPPSANPPWQGQAPMDGGWPRGGYHPPGSGFREMPDRMRKPEDDPRYVNAFT